MEPGGVRYVQFTGGRNFGVEVEVNATVTQAELRNIIVTADPHHPVHVSGSWKQDHHNGYWSVKRDGSCKGEGCDFGWEVSSYVGNSIKDVLTLGQVVGALKKAGVKANHNCAVHVHAEVADFTPGKVAGLIAHWMRIERVVTEMVPHRRIKCAYSKPLTEYCKDWLEPDRKYRPTEFYTKIAPKPYPQHYTGWRPKDRRLAVNLTNYQKAYLNPHYNYRKTVELRLPEGCVEPRHVTNWVKFFLTFVNRCSGLSFPAKIEPLGLDGVLSFLGLAQHPDDPLILSQGMHSLKVWLLDRINTHARDDALRTEAVEALNQMVEPLRTVTKVVPEKKKRKGGVRKPPVLPDLPDLEPLPGPEAPDTEAFLPHMLLDDLHLDEFNLAFAVAD